MALQAQQDLAPSSSQETSTGNANPTRLAREKLILPIPPLPTGPRPDRQPKPQSHTDDTYEYPWPRTLHLGSSWWITITSQTQRQEIYDHDMQV